MPWSLRRCRAPARRLCRGACAGPVCTSGVFVGPHAVTVAEPLSSSPCRGCHRCWPLDLRWPELREGGISAPAGLSAAMSADSVVARKHRVLRLCSSFALRGSTLHIALCLRLPGYFLDCLSMIFFSAVVVLYCFACDATCVGCSFPHCAFLFAIDS